MRQIATATVLALCLLVASTIAHAQGARGGLHTKVVLLADRQSIAPGERFSVGLLMHMDQGWHTYWRNPGEAGLATRISWSLPEGFVAQEIRWPLPHKFLDSGDVLTYGYADEVMLIVDISPPATLSPGSSVTLKGKASWLECEAICVPGEAPVELTLPVTGRSGAPANAALFERWSGRVPPAYRPGGSIRLSTAFEAQKVDITLVAESPARFSTRSKEGPDFYPAESDDLLIGRTAVASSADTVRLSVPVSAVQEKAAAAVLRGVILYTPSGESPRAQSIEIPLSAEFLSHAAQGSGTPSILDRTFTLTRAPGSAGDIALYLLFALIGGLILNIMPCVLPVIALKVFGLVKMAGDQPRRIARLGWAFSAGILASFLALALLIVLLQAAGQQVGWGFQFQEPRFVIAMAAIVFAFGLSLFGVFEIQPPRAAVEKVGGMVEAQRAHGKGYGASFAEGIFATVLATPCTAPFLGSALGFAFSQRWWTILLVFTFVAIGMALPYLILTARPAYLRYLPKGGAWMETVKQFMGFLMMATLLWLLYVLGKQLGMEALVWTGAFLLSLGVACWIVGRFATLSASRRSYWLSWLLAIVVSAGGYLVFLEGELNIGEAIAGVSDAPADSSALIDWRPYSLAGLQEAISGDSPVFVDFTAEWCLTCKVNEKTVLNSRSVVDTFRALRVVAIRADWTRRNPELTRLIAKFGRSGVPLYVIFPPGKPDAPVVLPEVISTSVVIDALKQAKGARISSP